MSFVQNSISSATSGDSLQVSGNYNIQLSGTFVGTFVLERSFDNGLNWAAISKNTDGAAASYTAPVSLSVFEPKSGPATPAEPNVLVRWRCTAYTSGTCVARISD